VLSIRSLAPLFRTRLAQKHYTTRAVGKKRGKEQFQAGKKSRKKLTLWISGPAKALKKHGKLLENTSPGIKVLI